MGNSNAKEQSVDIDIESQVEETQPSKLKSMVYNSFRQTALSLSKG